QNGNVFSLGFTQGYSNCSPPGNLFWTLLKENDFSRGSRVCQLGSPSLFAEEWERIPASALELATPTFRPPAIMGFK
ncbi:hypothetical protein JW916_04290, partial [Candidatus Sumerlaeota bacterium]|nr:hypothetical protein [Candidatus Sumerlaeota bacterium]